MLDFRNKINKLVKKNKKSFTIGEIVNHFKQDGIFAILFIITFPTSIPSPIYGLGSSTIIGGLITFFLSFQLLLGYRTAYLPDFILNKKIKITSFRERYYKRFDEVLFKMECYFKKGHQYAFNFLFLKISSLLMLLNSILMFIPLILTNWLPSTTVTFMSFAYLSKDGFMFLLSLFFAVCVLVFYFYAFSLIISYLIKHKNSILKKNAYLSKYFNTVKNKIDF